MQTLFKPPETDQLNSPSIIERNMKQLQKFSKEASELRRSEAIKTKKQRAAAVIEYIYDFCEHSFMFVRARAKRQSDTIARKTFLCGRWERIRQENAGRAEEMQKQQQVCVYFIGSSLREVQLANVRDKAGCAMVAMGSRVQQMATQLIHHR